MEVWKKKTIRWTVKGEKVRPGTPGAKRLEIPSKRYYGTLKSYDGKSRQVPLSEDKEAAAQLLRRLQTEEDRKRAVGVSAKDEFRKTVLSEIIADYRKQLTAKDNTVPYVTMQIGRLTTLADSLRWRTFADIDAGQLANKLAEWRKRKKRPISITTTNHYIACAKGLTRWLWITRKTTEDVLISLRPLNAKVGRKHVRRALSADEIKLLIDTTAESKKTQYGLRCADRAVLYLLAVFTGLRAGELASLTVSSFDLEKKTITVQAEYSKHRRMDVVPLHSSILDRVAKWLDEKKSGRLFGGTWRDHRGTGTVRMFRKDLKRAGIPYKDDAGRCADFHSLRHTFISSLARNGVHPSKARELARHSTIVLTMDHYTHCATDELRTALESLPGLE